MQINLDYFLVHLELGQQLAALGQVLLLPGRLQLLVLGHQRLQGGHDGDHFY